jgi:ribosomal protein L14
MNKSIGLENKLVELGEQKRKFQSRGQSATHAPASTHHRVLGLVLVHQVEIICKVLSCSVQSSTPNILAKRHHMLQVIIRITQVHQDGTTLQFTQMVVSIVVNWDIMLASTQNVTSRPPKKTTVKDSDNHHLRYVMEVQILKSIRVNGITCVAE